MKKYTLIIFNRYEVAKSKVINYNTYEHNLGLAFREALVQLWEGEESNYKLEFDKIKGYNDQIGIDFEEESYLFFLS